MSVTSVTESSEELSDRVSSGAVNTLSSSDDAKELLVMSPNKVESAAFSFSAECWW